ncbi:MAG TPA: hypothetical protein VH328_14185, partial [Burkholderiaceae bacterium]|nr:hypothetical protein [Burkholderiaceae bacterium]
NPKHAVGAIITSRPEGVRAQTADWLARHGVRHRDLYMVPVQTQAEVVPYLKSCGLSRSSWKAMTAMKALSMGCEMFVESHDRQAREISKYYQGLLVWCTDSQKRYRDGAETAL